MKNGIPLANAVDPTARIAAGVTFGTGNVVKRRVVTTVVVPRR